MRRRPALGARHAPQLDAAELEDRTTTPPDGDGSVVEDARLGPEAELGAPARIARCALHGVALAGRRWRSITLVEAVRWTIVSRSGKLAVFRPPDDKSIRIGTGASLDRVVFERCRMTGFAAPELDATDVVFRDCTLDLANFRFARLQQVTFEGCRLDEADFSGARLRRCRFDGSTLRGVELRGAELSHVDLRGADLDGFQADPAALAGAIVDSAQLVGLAHSLAAGLGIEVDDEPAGARG